ncbi:LysR substrate-binding domain-containing protein [Cupriavidus basilensis]
MSVAPVEIAGTVRVGVTETITAYVLPGLLASIERKFPGLRLEVLERERHDIGNAASWPARSILPCCWSRTCPVSTTSLAKLPLRSPRQLGGAIPNIR